MHSIRIKTPVMVLVLMAFVIMTIGCASGLRPWQSPTKEESSAILMKITCDTKNSYNECGVFPSDFAIYLGKVGSTEPVIVDMGYKAYHAMNRGEFPWSPMLLRVPPGQYYLSHAILTMGCIGYDDFTIKLDVPESFRKPFTVEPGKVHPIGTYEWELDITMKGGRWEWDRVSRASVTDKDLWQLVDNALKNATSEWKSLLEKARAELDKKQD